MSTLINRRTFLVGASTTAGLAGLSACAADDEPAQEPDPAATATTDSAVFAQSVRITSLETGGSQPQDYPAGYEAAFAIYAGLVRFGPDLNFEPDLATEWEVADDNVTWTFHLRDDVVFHDGTPFDAEAVVTYFTRMLDNTYNLSAYTLWEPIDRVEEADTHVVRVITRNPYGALLNTIAHGSALIPSPAALEEHGDDIGVNPVGAGPYQLDSFEPGNRLVVTAYPDYHGAEPIYETITFEHVGDGSGRVAALQSGQANIIDAVPVEQADQLVENPDLNVFDIPGLQCFGIGLNQTNSLLTDRMVRQALNFAVDKSAIVSALFRGYATEMTSPLAPHTNGYIETGRYEHSPEQATSMLADAGFTEGDDGVLHRDGERFSLRLRAPDGLYPNDVQVAEVIQEQLRAVGVEVTIEPVDPSTFWDGITVPQADVDFDLVLFGFNPSHASGLLQLDALYLSNDAPDDQPRLWNFNWYSNGEVDTLIEQAHESVDEGDRDDLLGQAQQLLWDDAPYIWLYVPNILTAYDNEVAKPVVLPVVFVLPSRAQA